MKQCWNIVNWTLRNKLQWNFNRNSYIFIQENVSVKVIWKMAAILFRPQCVNTCNISHRIRPYAMIYFSIKATLQYKFVETEWCMYASVVCISKLTIIDSDNGCFCITTLLCEESTSHGWIPVTGGFPTKRESNADLWCFLSCLSKQTAEQKLD